MMDLSVLQHSLATLPHGNSADVLAAAVHAALLSDGFKAITDERDLASQWKVADGIFVARYNHSRATGEEFIVKLVATDGILAVYVSASSVMAAADGVLECSLDLAEHVVMSDPLTTSSIRNPSKLFATLTEKIFARLVKSDARVRDNSQSGDAASAGRAHGGSGHHSSSAGLPALNRDSRPSLQGYDRSPFEIGRGDLLPGGGGMGAEGGMVVGPHHPLFGAIPRDPRGDEQFGPNRLPPGSVPPGARFDPIFPHMGPNVPGRGFAPPRGGPDPDDMRMPGFDYDLL